MQEVLQADWQEAGHSPQPPVRRVFFSIALLTVVSLAPVHHSIASKSPYPLPLPLFLLLWNKPHPMQFPSGQLCLFNFIISNMYGQLTATSLILVLFLVLNFTLCLYFKLLYFILFWCILILVAAVALRIRKFSLVSKELLPGRAVRLAPVRA